MSGQAMKQYGPTARELASGRLFCRTLFIAAVLVLLAGVVLP
jgi:hypothetical protein